MMAAGDSSRVRQVDGRTRISARGTSRVSWPATLKGHARAAMVALCVGFAVAPTWAQGNVGPAVPGAGSLPQTSLLLQPAISELQGTVAALRIAKWKAPEPVRTDAEQNLSSIDRDINNTLPGLIGQADAPPRSVANAFAVYRNLDALYEVLLRVSGTADLAAPDAEAAMLTHSLATLDASRRSLADAILAASRAEEVVLAQPRVAVAPPPPAAPVATTVVSDGPAVTSAHRKTKPKPKAKATTAPAATPPQ